MTLALQYGVAGPLAWGLGGWEVVVVLVGILVLFGGKKLPELARGLGKGLRNFRDEVGAKGDTTVEQDQQPRLPEDESR